MQNKHLFGLCPLSFPNNKSGSIPGFITRSPGALIVNRVREVKQNSLHTYDRIIKRALYEITQIETPGSRCK